MVSKFRKQIDPSSSSSMPNPNQFQPAKETDELSGLLTGLTKFMGAAGVMATEHYDKKIAEDTVIQTKRAYEGQTPSDEATVGGRRAASLVGVKLESAKASAKVSALAETDIEEEEFEEGIRAIYGEITATVKEKYGVLDKDIQEAMLVEMQKSIIPATATREAFKIKADITQRTQDLSDLYVLRAGEEAGTPMGDSMLSMVTDAGTDQLQLTTKQQEDALIAAIENSEDPRLVEYSKTLKNKNGVSLYDRTGSIKKMDAKIVSDNARQNSGRLARFVEENDLEYTTGKISRPEYEARVAVLNEQSGNQAYSKGSVEKIHQKADAEQKTQFNINKINLLMDESTGGYVNSSILNDREKQQLLDGRFQAHYKDSEDMGQAIRMTIADAHTTATTVARFENALTAFANVNVDANVLTEGDVTSFNKQIARFAEIVDVFPPEELDNYTVKKTQRIITNYNTLKSQGLSSSAALKQAQVMVRNNTPQNAVALTESTDVVVESMNPYFGFNPVKSHQEGYINSIVKDQLSMHSNPASEESISIVKNWASSQMTVIDGNVLRGNPATISTAFGVHQDQIGKYHDAAIEYHSKAILNKLQGTGLGLEAAWLDINPRTGIATVMFPHMTTDISFPSSDVKSYQTEVVKRKGNKVAKARADEKARLAKQPKDAREANIYSQRFNVWDAIFN
jgi:hypothetical protein